MAKQKIDFFWLLFSFCILFCALLVKVSRDWVLPSGTSHNPRAGGSRLGFG